MKSFKGLSLEPADALRNIGVMVEAALLIAITDSEDKSDLSDCIFDQVILYARASRDYALEKNK